MSKTTCPEDGCKQKAELSLVVRRRAQGYDYTIRDIVLITKCKYHICEVELQHADWEIRRRNEK